VGNIPLLVFIFSLFLAVETFIFYLYFKLGTKS